MQDKQLNEINKAIDEAFDHEAAKSDSAEVTPWFQQEKNWRPGPVQICPNSIW